MAGSRRTLRRPASADRGDDQREEARDDQPDEPRRGRSASRPSRRSAPSPRRDEDDTRSSRRSRSTRDDDDGDDEKTESVSGGWGGWRETRSKHSNFGEDFKVEYKRRYLIRILDDEPFATFGQHWLDDMPPKTRKSYVCLEEDCPLCDILDDKAKPLALFNVLEFVETKQGKETVIVPKLKVWQIGSGVVQILEDYADDPKTSPISDFYWAVSKSKGANKGPTTYTITPVKERDVKDDWDAEPLTDEEWDEFQDKKFDSTFVKRDKRADLQEIAEDLAED